MDRKMGAMRHALAQRSGFRGVPGKITFELNGSQADFLSTNVSKINSAFDALNVGQCVVAPGGFSEPRGQS